MVAEAGSAALAEPRWHSNAAVAATLRNAAQFAQRRGQRSHLLSAAENATSLPRGCPKGARANYPMSNYPISVWQPNAHGALWHGPEISGTATAAVIAWHAVRASAGSPLRLLLSDLLDVQEPTSSKP